MKCLSILLVLPFVGLLGCTSLPDAFISFKNNSNIIVYVNRDLWYPVDSTIIFQRDFDTWWDRLPPSSSCRYPAEPGLYLNGYGGSWNRLINDSDGYVSFYILDQSNKEAIESSSIDNHYPVLVRYDLTVSDLERLDYYIEYPPTEQMSVIHMYPPYESFIANDSQ